VPRSARACPECGADDRSGWNETETRTDGLDLPDENFDYEETLKNEGLRPRVTARGVPVFWWCTGLLLILILAGLALLRR
jgi:hypothetical protein